MRLHRQYRTMEDSRRRILEKGKGISKQSRLLSIFQSEKENLLTDLQKADSERNRAIDKQTIATILQIMEFFDKCHADILLCNKSIKGMVSNVDTITRKLVAQKLKVQALYGMSMTVPEAERRRTRLEDRLYHVSVIRIGSL